MHVIYGIGLGLMAVEQVFSGVSSFTSGKAEAKAAEQTARSVEESAEFNDQLRVRKLKKILGSQVAEASKYGSIPKSTYATIIDTAVESEFQGDIDKYNAKIEANRIREQGQLAKSQGTLGLIQGLFGAGASVGAGWSKWNDVRIPKASKPVPKFVFGATGL